MTEPTRLAGWGRTTDGVAITWTMAEGRRGRRWREVAVGDDGMSHALLLETGPDGRFSHLELARPDGLWTFHPEPDGTLHGNAVRAGLGMRHVEGWPFGPDAVLVVEGSAIGDAAVAWHAAPTVGLGAGIEVPAVLLRTDGALEAVASIRIERRSEAGWRIGEGRTFEIDPSGAPRLDDGGIVPLELE
jgi:hypothetical protein